ncbi:MAG: PaaI family thioesterase [Anaerolineales bacterium]
MPSQKPIKGSPFLGPNSLNIDLYADADGVFAPLVLDARVEGPPGHAHGGFSAALLDETMGAAVWRAGFQAVAAHISFDFHKPVPLAQEVQVRGWVETQDGRKVHARSEIRLPDGQLAVSGRGIFVHAPHLFEHMAPEYADAFRSEDEIAEDEIADDAQG